MKGQKKLCFLLCCMLLFLGGAALLVYLADPFFHYHAPWFGLKAVEDEKEYQVPGMLENFAYDSVLAGSSVVMSMNTDTIDERFGCRTVKAVGGSASAPLLDAYLELAFASHKVRYVFYGVDVFSFYHQPDMRAMSQDVEYLVNDNPFDDVEYLLNMDIIGQKIPAMLVGSQDPAYEEGLMYQLNKDAVVGPEEVLKRHIPGVGRVQEPKPLTYQQDWVTENISRLEARVRENPDTEFFFFVPPYSIVWWDDAYEKGLLGTYLYTLEQCMARLLPYENASFYATEFQEAETITDLYQYMDYIHGSESVTERMAQKVGTPEDKITLENYEEKLTQLEEVFWQFRTRVEKEGYGFVYEGAMGEAHMEEESAAKASAGE